MDWRHIYQLSVMTRSKHWLLNEDLPQICGAFRDCLRKIETVVGREEVEEFLKRKSPGYYDLLKWLKDKSGDFNQDEVKEKLIDHFKNNPHVKDEDKNYFVRQGLNLKNHPDNIRTIYENFPEEANAYIENICLDRYSKYLKIFHSDAINDPKFIKDAIAQATEDIGIDRSPAKRYKEIIFLAGNNPSLFKECYSEMDLTKGQLEVCELAGRVAAMLPSIKELSNSKHNPSKVADCLNELAAADPKAFNFCQFNAKILGLDTKLMDSVRIPDSDQYYNKERVFKCRLIVAYNLNRDPKFLAKTAKLLYKEDPDLTQIGIKELPPKLKAAYITALKSGKQQNRNTKKHSKNGKSEIGS